VLPVPAPDDPAAVLTRMLHAIDFLDWAGVRACLADEVRTDYTELFGGQAETLPADELVKRWQGLVPGFDATQHMTGPCLVDDRDGAVVAQTHVRAYHRIGDAVWGVHGHYVVPLERTSADWRIAGITLRMFYQEGDPDLPARAAERAGVSPRVTRAQ
jgi:hypothetical protein